jgi:hypothetical protein
MSVPVTMTGESEEGRTAVVFLSDMTAVLGLLVLGFPLTPATIRTTLVGWFLVTAGVMQLLLGHSQTTGLSAFPRTSSARSRDYGRSRSTNTAQENNNRG